MSGNVIGMVRHHKIIAFAKTNNLSIVIKWSSEKIKWVAAFENTMMIHPGSEASGDGISMLTEASGMASTPDEALEALRLKINSQTLVVEPFGGKKSRRTIPVLL
jgi:hypothetical protein